MAVTGSMIFFGLIVGLYVFVVIDRICKCFENCAMSKATTTAYQKLSPEFLAGILEKNRKKNDGN